MSALGTRAGTRLTVSLGGLRSSRTKASPRWPEAAFATVERDVEFLFNSQGAVVAFRHGRDVFDLDLCWLGWAPWNDGDVFDPAGRYLGTITPAGRLYEIEARRGLRSPAPRTPTISCHPDPPSAGAPVRLAAGMRDIRPRRLVRPHLLTDPTVDDGPADPISRAACARDSTATPGPARAPAAEVGDGTGALSDSSGRGGGVGSDPLPPHEGQTRPGQAPRERSRRHVGRPR